MNFPELTEAQGKLKNRQDQLAAIFAEANPGGEGSIDLSQVKCIGGTSTEKAEAIKALNDEMSALGTTIGNLQAVHGASESVKAFGSLNGEAGDSSERPASTKSFGEQFAESGAFLTKGSKSEIAYSVKALFDTDAGIPESTRSGLFVGSAQRPIQVTDLLPTVSWGQSSYKYLEETTFTNAAAERAEGTAYAEAALALTERARQIENIGVFLPMTDDQLEDGDSAAAYVNSRLPFMIRQRLDGQLLVGSGTTPNIEGINNVSGIQTQAMGTDSVPDAIMKALTKVRVTGRAVANAIVINPTDWQNIRLLRSEDTVGTYLWGNPSEAGASQIWGVNVVQSDAQTAATAIVGDFQNHSLLVERRGIEVKISDSHSTDFVNGKQAIRAGIRVAAVWTRPAAFATVTGLDGA
jgi:HK97 family phage major capsid protein